MKTRISVVTLPICVFLVAVLVGLAAGQQDDPMTVTVDPITRLIHVAYPVPADAPAEIVAVCSWKGATSTEWTPANVCPLVSETAMKLVDDATLAAWTQQGRIIERNAAGLSRTAVFNPYPTAQINGVTEGTFRVVMESTDGSPLAVIETPIRVDNSDVVYIEDWSQVIQKDAIAVDGEPQGDQWRFQTRLDASNRATLGNVLRGDAGPTTPLRQLTYPLDLRGFFALFVSSESGIQLRLSSDERTDPLSCREGLETLWRWAPMDRQHLVLKQGYAYTGCVAACIDYVKLVPLTEPEVAALDAQFGQPDKFIASYWEPYSYAFSDNVQDTSWHREYLTAYKEARVSLVDTQLGRFGMKMVYETRAADQLLYSTIGDPIGAVSQPTTDNVGRMQQYTNTLDATIRYATELGLQAHANFGASNCYPGTPLQGDFSKEHPDWMRGSALRFEIPEVRAFVMTVYRETLEAGAKGLSIDFCRYPETVDTVETGNTTMREIRALADEFGSQRGERIPILVRFPGTGVRRAELFDYATWAREGWVDYLCPSNIQGRHMHIDVVPYLEAVTGTDCQVLPALDGLDWGPELPGPFLWRVRQVYEQGAPGIYVYQGDARVLGSPGDRRCMRMLSSSEAVRKWWAEEERLMPSRSKGIYLERPEQPLYGYHGWERLRLWVEGVPLGELEMYLDGALVNRSAGPPYLLGAESYESDGVIPPGDHELRVRVKDGEGWLEQTFAIKGAG